MEQDQRLTKSEYDEALNSILGHYAMPVLLKEIDAILNTIKNGCMSVSLDASDPNVSAMKLLQERMKYEGADALKRALVVKIKEAKTKRDVQRTV